MPIWHTPDSPRFPPGRLPVREFQVKSAKSGVKTKSARNDPNLAQKGPRDLRKPVWARFGPWGGPPHPHFPPLWAKSEESQGRFLEIWGQNQSCRESPKLGPERSRDPRKPVWARFGPWGVPRTLIFPLCGPILKNLRADFSKSGAKTKVVGNHPNLAQRGPRDPRKPIWARFGPWGGSPRPSFSPFVGQF